MIPESMFYRVHVSSFQTEVNITKWPESYQMYIHFFFSFFFWQDNGGVNK